MKKGYVFPGQGSQFAGMGKTHYEHNPLFKNRCEQAKDILGFDLTEIMFDGPEEKLRQTENTQPAIFLHSVALFETLKQQPDMVAGHSLGEFSALVACKAVSFEQALATVRKRGQLMQQAGVEHPGTMAAVIGMEDDKVEAVCHKASQKTKLPVVAANYNSKGQLVISGHEEAIDIAIDFLKEEGCKLAKKLPVSGAFHSPLMLPAFEGLEESLNTLKISKPICPIYSNYTGEATIEPDEIRSNLLNQLLNPVRWTQTMINMKQDGANLLVEVGPGKVLQGLAKRTVKGYETYGYE
ncbi:MAG: ACP S-malonyltransferase [Balneolales bacterium]